MDVIKTNANALATTTPNGNREPPDGMFDRVLKLIPADVIAGYTALIAIVNTISTSSLRIALPVAMVACTVLAVFALRSASKHRKAPLLQYVFSLAAFWAWAFAIRDPILPFGYETPAWIPAFGCVLIPLFGSYCIDVVEN